ncbi:MAG TPA: beta-eliminating lyase-related protein, partial [Gammaproteobacteria bacterium]|nr:beta-eliminating lyase-related protein [Gammaproteobacteria bacterium]
RGLALHLDGARVFNAAVKLQVPLERITRHFDSVSLCLSKGLGAPVGTVLVGKKAFIAAAHRHRKLLGGGMRQAGILAAAGLYALEHHVERLAEDHANAKRLAEGLASLPGLRLDPALVHTNMVFASLAPEKVDGLVQHLKQAGIVILPNPNLRLVTHLDVSRDDIQKVMAAFKSFFH